MVNWGSEKYHPVVHLPDEYTILDLSQGTWNQPPTDFSIGKYNEVRPNLYNTELFNGDRNVHMGIDIGGPVGTPCMAFMDGEISQFGYNPAAGDYGNVIITKHEIDGSPLWALYGHLDNTSIEGKGVGQKIRMGDVIAWFGKYEENGGWAPHLHFQLSLIEPLTHDMPGVVTLNNREQALIDYPDPRLVLGALY